jgi:single-strand DNA-binding protein
MKNQWTGIGRLGKDPELKTLEGGKAMATVSLATSERWQDAQGEWQERTQWHNLVFWGKAAEYFARNYKKGYLVDVTGLLEYREYDNTEGNKVRTSQIRVERVIKLDNGRS